jgi:hypothetical protein
MRAAVRIPPPGLVMNQENSNSNDEKLSALLRNARATPSLPPRFQEGVWRRIEESEISTPAPMSWLDVLVLRTLRPRFALAVAVVLVVTGSVVGARQGNQAAHQDVQTRYVASVAPNPLR